MPIGEGAPGVDGQSIAAFEEQLEDNLYKVWNRMSAGSYFRRAATAAHTRVPVASDDDPLAEHLFRLLWRQSITGGWAARGAG